MADSEAAASEPLVRLSRAPSRPTRLAKLLARAAGRRAPSMLVRETAALQLEQRRADWAYSRPVVAVDVAWNLAFVAASAALLAATLRERPTTPVRVWIAGYALQCLVHVALVCAEYWRRRRLMALPVLEEGGGGGTAAVAAEELEGSDSEDEGVHVSSGRWWQNSFAKRFESLNIMASFVWWVIGFYWVVSGGDELMQNAPRLYWLTVVFLAFDVFFVIFCVALACCIGIALCCCLPCVIAILCALPGQEAASDADISLLPRYKYSESSDNGQKSSEEGIMIPILNNSGTSTSERILLHEDAECCICLTSYENGAELCALPCNHHFHSACIIKWVRIHATCPLCKYNILKGSDSL